LLLSLLLHLRGLLLRGLLLLSLPPATDPSRYAAARSSHGCAFAGVASNRAHGRT
jgi:hypothetical protein